MTTESSSERVDVLIVGSGPVGAAYARTLRETDPTLSVLMVDRGAALSPGLGTNLKNFMPGGIFSRDDESAEGVQELIPRVPAATLARSGTHLVDAAGPRAGHMPAAAESTNVGGMGAHWSCATPPPGPGERIPLIPTDELDELLECSARLLHSSTRAFGSSARGAAMTGALTGSLGHLLDRPVQPMPHACEPAPDGRLSWTGTDTVLGPLASGSRGFELRAETACTSVLIDAGAAVGGILRHTRTGRQSHVYARAVVVAADSLRTPQLLWASGVRPEALGRYLNEHPMVAATIVLREELAVGSGDAQSGLDAEVPAALWVPYAEGTHPFSGQIENSPGSPAGFEIDGLEGVPASRIVSLTWFCPKQPRAEDRVVFGQERDADGLPLPEVRYELTPGDRAVIDRAIELTRQAGESLGTFVAGQEPALLADGQSLHYMGTLRMGSHDDGASVCDPWSRVWGVARLYVGGNGVIPRATACNPTRTSVALAVRGARALAAELAP